MRYMDAKMRLDGVQNSLVVGLFAESKEMLQRVLDAFNCVMGGSWK